MASIIWSPAKLEELLEHSQQTVQEWAVAKLFYLYPEKARELLPRLLLDSRPAIVRKSLEFVGSEPDVELLPLLKNLYYQGSESVSARAMHVLGDWRAGEAVEWMRERILAESPLGKEQIVAMIYALGRIPEESSYALLKETEAAVQQRDSSRWDLFYASLLEHRRTQDLETLLHVVLDEGRGEERRRDALGLLLAQVDPEMNPSDVFFANHPAVRLRLENRLAAVEKTAAQKDERIVRSLRDAIVLLEDDVSKIPGALDEASAELTCESEFCRFSKEILVRCLAALREGSGVTGAHAGLACAALSAAIRILEERDHPVPAAESHWEAKLEYLLRNTPPLMEDRQLELEVMKKGERQKLVAALAGRLVADPDSWSALKALELLGALRAAEAADTIVRVLPDLKADFCAEAARNALLQIGLPAVAPLVARLPDAVPAERFLIMEVLAQLPTTDGVQALLDRLPSLYAENPERSLKVAYETGAKDFLSFLEKEYRPGEWDLGRVYLHICRVNEIEPASFAQIERDVQRGDAFAEESRRIWSGEQVQWPATLQLELACRECGKHYQYELQEIHQHPKKTGQEQQEEQDYTPYRHGLVIVDDLRCKNCNTLNQFELTARSFAQITAESLKLLAFQRLKMQPPSFYPFKNVQLDERDGAPMTLTDLEQEHLDAVRLHPSKPAAHLALGKFYEYVKEYPFARSAYLQALTLDARALEAMAGLGRLDHSEGKLQEALNWIESCYERLDRGNFYLTEDRSVFKKMVRQKRREFSRELGTKLEDKPVEIRFRFEDVEHPKNKPCPCGSGKKYKLCCMKRRTTE